MHIGNRLQLANDTVAFYADRTWLSNELSPIFQKANLGLYLRIQQNYASANKLELRPRTVRDCIPKSKLARYSNYDYSDSRELSYAPSTDFPSSSPIYYAKHCKFRQEVVKEPWMLPEVDDLFQWYSQHDPSIAENKNVKYESPSLRTKDFNENALKLLLQSEFIRKLWDCEKHPFDVVFGDNDKILSIYKTPCQNYFLTKSFHAKDKVEEENFEYFTPTSDFSQLKQLADLLEEQNNWISKHLSDRGQDSPINCHNNENSNSLSSGSKRLYSAVLQGLTSSKLSNLNDCPMTILNKHANNNNEDDRKRNDDFFKLNTIPEQMSLKEIKEDNKTDDNTPKLELQTPPLPPFPAPNNFSSLPPMQNSNKFRSFPIVSNEINTNSNFVSFNSNFQVSTAYHYSTTSPSVNHFFSSYNNLQNNLCHVLATNRNLQSISMSTRSYTNSYQLAPSAVMMVPPRHNLPPISYHQPSHTANFYPNASSMTMNRSIQPPNPFRSLNQLQFPQQMAHQQQQYYNYQNNSTQNFIQISKSNMSKQHFKNTTSIVDARKCPPSLPTSTGAANEEDNSKAGKSKAMEEVISKTIGILLEDRKTETVVTDFVPVNASKSDELEMQALEQYSSSASQDNVYQELERQAEEQYLDFPENVRSPPNYSKLLLFGGVVM